VFHLPAVAGMLGSKFVESRLHMDGPKKGQFVALRDRLAKTPAAPTFVVIRPDTGESLGVYRPGNSGPSSWGTEFENFIAGVLDS